MARKGSGTICIVDTDRELHAILAATFALEGFRVVSSTRSREALNKMNIQKFAAIFIDPGKESDHMSEIFKVNGSVGAMNAKTPMVVISGNPDSEIPPQSLPLIAAVVAKPFSLDEIVAVLRNVTAS